MAISDFLKNNSAALMAASAGLLGGRTGSEQLSLGMGGAAKAIGARQSQNKTLNFLRTINPQLAQAVEAGALSPLDAYKSHLEAAKPKRTFQTLPDGTYGWADANSGEFQTMGQAQKPAPLPGEAQEFEYAKNNGFTGNFMDYQSQRGGKDSNITADIDARKNAATQMGLTPDSPAYQSYVLSGKMPREDAQPLTATDKKAILEADEAVQANKSVIDNLKSVTNAPQGGTSLNDRAGSGMLAGTQSFIARNDPTGFFDDKKGEATTELNNVVISNSLGQLKAVFGGNPTEGERAALRDLEASVDKTPQERKIVIDRAIALAEKRMQFSQERADALRGNTFYKPQQGANVDDLVKKYGY